MSGGLEVPTPPLEPMKEPEDKDARTWKQEQAAWILAMGKFGFPMTFHDTREDALWAFGQWFKDVHRNCKDGESK